MNSRAGWPSDRDQTRFVEFSGGASELEERRRPLPAIAGMFGAAVGAAYSEPRLTLITPPAIGAGDDAAPLPEMAA